MTSLSGCERAVVETLISIFKNLSNCQASSSESEVIVVEKVLRNLLALNETMGNDVDIMSPEEIFFRESIDPQVSNIFHLSLPHNPQRRVFM